MRNQTEIILDLSLTKQLLIHHHNSCISRLVLLDLKTQKETNIQNERITQIIEQNLKKNLNPIHFKRKILKFYSVFSLTSDQILGGGNNQTVQKKQLPEQKSLQKSADLKSGQNEVDIESQVDKPLLEQYENIIIKKNEYISTQYKEIQYENVSKLKFELVKFLDDNQEKILDNYLQSRYILYRFFNDFKDLYFLTLQKKFENSQDLIQKLSKVCLVLSQGDINKKPFLDIQEQFTLVSNLERFKTTKIYEQKLDSVIQEIHSVHQSIYLNYQAFEQDKKTFGPTLKKMIKEQKQHFQTYMIDISKEHLGEEVISCLQSKFDIILEQINFDATEKELGILNLLSENVNPNLHQEILSKIMLFFEKQLIKSDEEIVIKADNRIVKFFLKNLIQIALTEQAKSKQGDEFTNKRFMIQVLVLHLLNIFELQGQQNTSTYEELWLFLHQQESFQTTNLKLSLASLQKSEFQIPAEQIEEIEQMIKLKFSPQSIGDIIDYIQILKTKNKLIQFNFPFTTELNIFTQNFNYLGGDQFPLQIQSDEQQKAPNIYQQVISYFKKEDSFLKFIIIAAPSDSGKTTFLKKLINQIEEHNKVKDSNPIYSFYLRAKYIDLKSSFDDILLSDPFNFSIGQRYLFLDSGIKLIIIDGLNVTQSKRKQFIKLLKSVKGKNIHFLITTREDNLKQDVFFNLKNYMLLELQTVLKQRRQDKAAGQKKEKDTEFFKQDEQYMIKTRKIDISRLQIQYLMDKTVNLFMFNEMRIKAQEAKAKGRFIDIITKIQDDADLVEQFIDASLQFAMYHASRQGQDQETKSKDNQVSMANQYEIEQHVKLCKQYLETVAYVAFLKEYERGDEDFSVNEEDLEPYLTQKVSSSLGQILQTIQWSSLILSYSDNTLFFSNNQKQQMYFKLTQVFVYFLTSALASDFNKQYLDVTKESDEELSNYKIAQRPIVKKPVNKLQIQILDQLFYKLQAIKFEIPPPPIEEIQEEQQNLDLNEENNNNNQEEKKDIPEIKVEKKEGIQQLNQNLINFMKRTDKADQLKLRMGCSNIISAIFQSNLSLDKYDFQNIQFPQALISQQYCREVKFSSQEANQIILTRSSISIPNVQQSQKSVEFGNLLNVGSRSAIVHLISFNDDTLFFISNDQVYKYIIKNQKYIFSGVTNFKEEKSLHSLKRSKSYLFCCVAQQKFYMIQPDTMIYTPLLFRDQEPTINSFDVSNCGQFLVTTNNNYSIKIWDIQVKQQTLNIKKQYTVSYSFHFIKFFQDPTIITFMNDNRLYVFNTIENEGKAESEYTYLLSHYVGRKYQWADQYGDFLAAGNNDGILRIFQISENYKLIENVQLHNDWIRHVQFSSCGKYVLSSADDVSASIYDIEKKTSQYLRGKNSNYVMFGAFINNNKMVATVCNGDNYINLWDTSHITENAEIFNQADGLSLIEQKKQKDPYIGTLRYNTQNCLAISNDNKTFATGSLDSNVYIWNLVKYKEEKQIQLYISHRLEGHFYEVLGVAYSHDGKLLASCSNDRTILVWNAEQNYQVASKGSVMEHDEAVNCVTFSPNSTELASGGWDDLIKIWKVLKSDQNYIFKLQNELQHEKAVLCIAYSPSGEVFVSGSADKTIQIWKTKDYEPYQQVKINSDWIYSLTFSSDNKYLFTGSKDQTLKIFDVYKNFSLVYDQNISTEVSVISTIKKGQIIFTGTMDQYFNIHKSQGQNNFTKTQFDALEHPINALSVSKNQKLIVYASMQCLKVQKFNNYLEEVPLTRHEHEISFLTFTSNGILVSIDVMGNLKMWDAKLSFKQIVSIELNHLNSNKRQTYNAAFSFNNEYFVTHTHTEWKVWDKNLKVISQPCSIENSELKFYFSPNGTYLVCFEASLGLFLYKASDNFKEGQKIEIGLGNLTWSQYRYMYKEFKNSQPFYYNFTSENYINCVSSIQFVSLKFATFSSDEKLMYIYARNNSSKDFVLYQFVDQTFKIEDNHGLDNIVDADINYDIFYQNESIKSRLTQEEYEKYFSLLVMAPYKLYNHNNFITSKFKFISCNSFDGKYFATGCDPSSIQVWNLQEFIKEYYEEQVIEIEEEEIKVEEVVEQNQQLNEDTKKEENQQDENKLNKQQTTILQQLQSNQGDVLLIENEEQDANLNNVTSQQNEEGQQNQEENKEQDQQQQEGQEPNQDAQQQNEEGQEQNQNQNENDVKQNQEEQQQDQQAQESEEKAQVEEVKEEKKKKTKTIYIKRMDYHSFDQYPNYLL